MMKKLMRVGFTFSSKTKKIVFVPLSHMQTLFTLLGKNPTRIIRFYKHHPISNSGTQVLSVFDILIAIPRYQFHSKTA